MSVKEQIVPFSWPTKCLFYRAATRGGGNTWNGWDSPASRPFFGICCAFSAFLEGLLNDGAKQNRLL